MDDNTRTVAEAMLGLARREMDYSRVRAVRVRLVFPVGPAMELRVESDLALDADEAGDVPAAAAVFTAAVPEAAA